MSLFPKRTVSPRPSNTRKGKPQKSIRWWPLITVLLLAVSLGLFIWSAESTNRQQLVLGTTLVVVTTILFTNVWLLFWSRLPRKTRLFFFGAMVLVLAAGFSLFRVRGISGDFVPIWEWRWIKTAGDSAFEMTGKMSADRVKALASSDRSPSADYPQFLGPHRNAKLAGIRLARDWEQNPPELLWRQEIGDGWSAFAVIGNLAITQEQRGETEMVVCYELSSGEVVWAHEDRARYASTIAGNGPRATPTIVGDRLYTVGATGILNCLDLFSGRKIWSRNIVLENKAVMNEWGVSGSPLVMDSLVIVSAGGAEGKSLVAYDKENGEVIWSAGNDPAGYSSPLLTTLVNMPQILIFNRGNVVAHSPLSGEILWQHSWPLETQHIAQPLPLPGDRVFVSSGYGIGSKLFRIRCDRKGRWHTSLIWETPRLKVKFSNVVYEGGYIYGLDDGVLTCLDVADGQRKWKAGRYGHGQLILIEDLLLIQAEKGDVVLVEAIPDCHRELSRLAALNGKTWNNPAFARPYLLVRNNREAACFKLPLNAPEKESQRDGR